MAVSAAAGAPASAAAAGGGDPAALQQQIAQLNSNMTSIQAQIDHTDARLQQAEAQAAYWQRARGVTQSQISTASIQVQQLQQQMMDVQKQADATTQSLEADEQRLQTLQERSDAGLRALDEGGTVGLVSVLLGSTNFGDFLTRFHLLQAIYTSEVQTMRAVGAERDAVVQEQKALQDKQQQLTALEGQAEQAVAQLQTEAATYQKYTSAAEAQAVELEAEMRAEQAASAQVTQELGSLRMRYDRASGRLTFDWPLPPPYTITSPFGERYLHFLHRWDFHTGIDIAEPSGTPIHAAAAGVVAVAGWQGGYGNAVILYHGKLNGNAMYTLYAHQSRIGVHVGEVVQQGQVIGYVGMTGNASGPHLHFEVRVNGKPVNPMPYLPPAEIIQDY